MRFERRAWGVRALALVCGVWLVFGLPAAARADTTIDLSAQVRWRGESESDVRPLPFAGEPTPAERGGRSMQFLRSRLAADLRADQVRIFFQVQDARVLGSPPSGGRRQDTNLGVHQGFLQLNALFWEPLAFRAGRQELSFGNERLVGAVAWSNIGRTFDAIRFNIEQETWDLSIFQAKLVDRIDPRPDQDRNFIGANVELIGSNDDVFLFWDRDDERAPGASERRLDRFTLGAYLDHNWAPVTAYGNVAYQFGSQSPDSVKTDISAFLVTAEVALTTGSSNRNRLAGGVDWASGDDPDTADYEAFDNLYYTGHKFRGFQDQFLRSIPEGLLDLYVRNDYRIGQVMLRGDLHYFRFDRARMAADGGEALYVGTELDLGIQKRAGKHAMLRAIGTAFWPSQEAYGEQEAQLWGYLSVTVNL